MPALLHLLVPPLCSICAEPCGGDEEACARCLAGIAAVRGGAFVTPGIEAAWAAAAYEGVARRLVTQLKFGRRLALARVAAEAIVAVMPRPPTGATAVPVPADPIRLRMRGFDPAHVIAGQLASCLELSLSDCLSRRHARRQVGRSRDERVAGPRVRAVGPAPAEALLVDDVVTTGATLAASARALRRAGSARVLAVAFARA